MNLSPVMCINNIKDLDNLDYKNMITLYIFTGENCPPCRNLKRAFFETDKTIIALLSEKRYNIPIVLFFCNIEDNIEIKNQFGVRSIPSCVAVCKKNNKETHETINIVKNFETVEAFCEKLDNLYLGIYDSDLCNLNCI